jgi:uncharacterized protein (UPF0248 family)
MIPIQDLLHRIRWDPEFGSGEFVIGYYDRVEHKLISVPFLQISFPKDGPVFSNWSIIRDWHIPFPCIGSDRFTRTAS